MNETNQPEMSTLPTDLYLLNWRLGKENVACWWGIDTSNEVATGELTDNSNINIMTWYQWANDMVIDVYYVREMLFGRFGR